MKNVVVAMDSMKGCLDSLSASMALSDGIAEHSSGIQTYCVPVADGGEGTAVALTYGDSKFIKKTSKVTGPVGERISAEWYIDKESGTAFIDMASAAGIALISEDERNPLNTTSFGVGELIFEAVEAGAKKILLGLGGSATVDAGLGACQALGVKFFDMQGNEIRNEITGISLVKVNDFDSESLSANLKHIELSLLCDVTSPFTGFCGAARVFGPQKGASPEDVEILELGMENVRDLIKSKTGLDLNDIAGSGAAGGMGGGLMSLAGGKITKGASTILDLIGFDKVIERADLIITGEGSSDSQTLMGKIPYEILQRGKRKNIPVWLVAGRVKDQESLFNAGFEKIICINSPEIVARSKTEGQNPMDPDVAAKRLFSIIRNSQFS
ncbi:MAG: glycerate kinase [Muribaculaceae bacterium]|nr:glycerate kinase [Muribaculaceae bacterium]